MLTDEQIIKRVLRGDTGEFRALMQRHQGSVHRLAYRMLNRREDAEDVVQETFLRAYQSLATYSDRGLFWAWVRRIATNACLKRFQAEFPTDEIEALADLPNSAGNPVEAEALRHAEIEDVRRAVAGLPAIYRAVVVLRYDEDLTSREIGELLGISISAAKVRLHRAEKMLAERLSMVMQDEML